MVMVKRQNPEALGKLWRVNMVYMSEKSGGSDGEIWKSLHSLLIVSLPLDLSGASLQVQNLTCWRYFCWQNKAASLMDIWRQYPPFNFNVCTQILLCLLLIFSDNPLIHD